jgi:hypothetical protein
MGVLRLGDFNRRYATRLLEMPGVQALKGLRKVIRHYVTKNLTKNP